MKRVLAIARLTFWEGIRMRVVLVCLIVLVILVLRMPFALRGDETLAGRLQNFLAYSLGALGLLLSLTTAFFSCATLSGEFKSRSLHLVVTKPVSRFEILFGKWLGVNLLNILILALCGAAIYGLACFIRSRPEQFVRDRYKIRDVVWTARHAARPVVPEKEIAETAAARVNNLIQQGELDKTRRLPALAEEISAGIKRWRVVQPGYVADYRFENLTPPEPPDTVIQVRFKVVAQPVPMDEMVTIGWVFCDPNSGAPLSPPTWTRERSSAVHQFLVRAAPVIRNGQALLQVLNDPARGPTTFVFDGADSLEILYKVGGFELNFVRALLIILLRLTLLSALGVFFSVFVSFPVACLCTLSFYVICLGQPFWLEAMGAGNEGAAPQFDPFGVFGSAIRTLLVPLVRLGFPDFSYYDGVDRLIDGVYIPNGLVVGGLIHTLLYGTVLLFGPGWLIFRSREVAEVQV